MTTGCYEVRFCCLQMPGGGGSGDYKLPNARSPGLIVHQMPRVWPGGMLAAGIDSDITYHTIPYHTVQYNTIQYIYRIRHICSMAGYCYVTSPKGM